MALTNNRTKTLVIPTIAIGTANSPVDKASVVLPKDVLRWIAKTVLVRAVGASSSMAAASIDIRTAANGGGSSILSSALSLAALTGADNLLDQASLATNTSAITSTTLYLRQTVNSANVGNIQLVIEYLDLT